MIPSLTPEKISTLALNAMPIGMADAKHSLADIGARRATLCAKIGFERDTFGDGAVTIKSINHISDQERIQSQERLKQFSADVMLLDNSAVKARKTISSFEAENAAAVKAAMVPIRKEAAERLVAAIDAVLSDIEIINATGVALRDAGMAPTFVPAPLLTGVRTMALSIIDAVQPDLEKR